MRRVFKKFFLITALTGCALLYVALQIELYRVSYSIHHKKKALTQVQDTFERMTMRVSKLKALDILEGRIAEAQMDLTLPVEIKTLQADAPGGSLLSPIDATEKPSFSLLQFVREAHAKIISTEKE